MKTDGPQQDAAMITKFPKTAEFFAKLALAEGLALRPIVGEGGVKRRRRGDDAESEKGKKRGARRILEGENTR